MPLARPVRSWTVGLIVITLAVALAREVLRRSPGRGPAASVARVTGVVRDAGGKSLPRVDVALFRIGSGGGFRTPVRTARTDASGRFVLLPARPSRYLVVADDPERRPVGVVAEVRADEADVDAELVLPAGAAVSGRVRLAGRAPMSGVRVQARQTPTADGALLLLWRRGKTFSYFNYQNASVVRRGPATKTDADGRYRIAGLAPGLCTVFVRDRNLDDDLPAVPARKERLPASNVDFNLVGVPHVFSVVAHDEALAWARLFFSDVRFNDRGRMFDSVLIGDHGPETLRLVAGRTYRVRVTRPGYTTRAFDLVARDSVEPVQVVTRLEPAPESAVLNGTVERRDGQPVEEIYCWMQRVSGGSQECFGRVVSVRGGRFVVPGVPPGHWRVRLRAGSRRQPLGYCTVVEQRVDFPPREPVPVHAVFERGGRIRIAVRNRDGQFVIRGCRVRAANGAVLDVDLARRDRSSGGARDRTGYGPVTTDPPLSPGRYRVEFLDLRGGDVLKSFPVRVNAGHTTDVVWRIEE